MKWVIEEQGRSEWRKMKRTVKRKRQRQASRLVFFYQLTFRVWTAHIDTHIFLDALLIQITDGAYSSAQCRRYGLLSEFTTEPDNTKPVHQVQTEICRIKKKIRCITIGRDSVCAACVHRVHSLPSPHQ